MERNLKGNIRSAVYVAKKSNKLFGVEFIFFIFLVLVTSLKIKQNKNPQQDATESNC